MSNQITKSARMQVAQERSAEFASVPSKVVYITQDGNTPEYSFEEPAMLERFQRLLDGYYGSTNLLTLFQCLPEVYAPIHEIASRVAHAVWTLKRTYSDEPIYTDKDFNRLFSSPNPYMNIRQLVYNSVVYRILTGRQFWSMNKPTSLLDESYRSILSWFSLPSDKVYVKQKKTDVYTTTELDDIIERYEVSNVNGFAKRVFEPTQVIPMVNFSYRDPYNMNCADSFLMGAEKAIKNLIPVYEARGIIYIKRGALGFIVSNKTDASGSVNLTPDEKKEVLDDYHASNGVTDGRSPVGITSMPVSWERTSMSIEELQPFDETLSDAVAIYAVLRVPRHLVPSKDESTFNNTAEQMKGFYTNVIIPMAQEFADAWTIGMGFDTERKYIFPDYSHVNELQENQKERADVDKVTTDTTLIQYKENLITKDEALAKLGLPKLPTGGDTYAKDSANPDPLAIKLGVGGLQGLVSILTAQLSDDAKATTLMEVFGFTPEIAKKLSKKDETQQQNQQNPGNDATKKDKGNQAAGGTDQLQ